jgi:hypothetical protein
MSQESNVSANRSLTIASLQDAVQQAVQTGDWIVVVFPTTKASDAARNVLPAMLPEGSSGGGRTSLLPDGARLSVVSSSDIPFPTPSGFTAMFLGWGGATEKEFAGMATWRSASTKIAEEGRAA